MSSFLSSPAENAQRRPAPADVLDQLHRVLAHPLFSKSQRLSTLLRFTVEHALAGDSENLKEYVIGSEAFQRGVSFDPQTDNIVRVNANRLRSKLAEYYQDSGQLDPVAIELPRGGYVPCFFWRREHDTSAPFQHTAAIKASVGREHELTRLRTAFASAVAGSGLMVTVSGDAGLGKTTVVGDFLSEIKSMKTAAWVAQGRCSERLADTDGLVAILDCLDELTRGDWGPEALELMKSEAPTWLSQVSYGRLDSARPAREASQERMRREFVHFFESLTRIRPAILFLDDLHWADASTCDLLAHLTSRMRDMPLLIIATYRPSELTGTHPFFTVRLALERRGVSHDLPLSFLTQADVECYLNRRFPSHRYSAAFTTVVGEITEGHPLFMVDMVGFLVNQGILVEQDGQWSANRQAAEIRKLIPSGTQSMIRLQIERFDEKDRSLLQCAAAQGVEFDSAVIAHALHLDAAEVEERLQTLERVHRFVRSLHESEFTNHTISIRYRFVHFFYQSALYSDLTPTRRAAYGLALGESIIHLAGETGWPASELALLFESGRSWGQASIYFLKAARHAAGVFAYPESAILCRRGLKALLSLPESRERNARELEFSLTLGMAQLAISGYGDPDAEQTYRRSRTLCVEIGEKRRLVRVLWGLQTCLLNAGQLIPALELANEMRQIADELENRAAIIESLHALGTTLAFMGEVTKARDTLERIFELSPVGQHQFCGSLYLLDTCVSSLSMLARVLARMGRFEEAIAKARQSADLASELAHPPSVAYATFWVGWIHHARRDYARACPELETAMELSLTQGMPQVLEWGRVVRGSSLAHSGRVDEGIAEIRKSIDNLSAMRCLLERPYCLTLLAESLLLVNSYQEALALCDEALEIGDATHARSYQSETHRIRRKAERAILAPPC